MKFEVESFNRVSEAGIRLRTRSPEGCGLHGSPLELQEGLLRVKKCSTKGVPEKWFGADILRGALWA